MRRIGLLVWALACSRGGTVDSAKPAAQVVVSPQPAPAAVQPPSAVALATEWIDAVRHRDLSRVAAVTSYPFELRDTGRDATCDHRIANNRKELDKAVDCLLSSRPLQRAMADTPASGFVPLEPDSFLANWIEPWWRPSEHEHLRRVMTMVATSDGHEYDFQLLTDAQGVRVVWKLGAHEARE